MRLQDYKPYFYGFLIDKKLVGVTSFVRTALDEYRLRGTCVLENFRGQKIANHLIRHCLNQSQPQSNVWTLSRKENTLFYKKFGFEEKKEVTNFEFGPHMIMSLKV